MVAIIQDPTKTTHLKVELAVIVDKGKQFVQATYNLKGESLLVLHCYEQIKATFNTIQVQHFPNIDAVMRQLSELTMQPSHTAQEWKTYAQGCVQPGFDYLYLFQWPVVYHACSLQGSYTIFATEDWQYAASCL